MSTKEERIEELVSLYAVGSITDEELGELESYIAEAPDTVGKLIREHEEAASLLSFLSDETDPPAHIREDVLKRVRIRKKLDSADYSRPVTAMLQPVWYGFAGAAVALILVFVLSGYVTGMVPLGDTSEIENLSARVNEQKNTIELLRSELEDKETRLEEMNTSLALKDEKLSKYDDLIEYLRNPNVLVVDLSNLKSDLNSAGRVLWNRQKDSAIFYGINLPEIPEDKIYQLWAIIDSKPVSCGIFGVDQKGEGKLEITNLKDSRNIQKFAVTLEPAGGVPAPTGDMYLAGGI